jgi:hypothetical protein
MRKIVAIATAVVTMMSAMMPGYAQSVAARSGSTKANVNPVLVATFKAFPSGGQALTDRIRTLILQNNDVATDLARYLRSTAVLSAGQREAVEEGFGGGAEPVGNFRTGGAAHRWEFGMACRARGFGRRGRAGRLRSGQESTFVRQPELNLRRRRPIASRMLLPV